nr:MAG: Thymidylate synthase complementing protein [Bacteriophage sp.]
MLKCKVLGINGVDHAIRGMRNPMNSWSKSDSCWKDSELNPVYHDDFNDGVTAYSIGENDKDLMKRLFKGGTEHRKYLRMIQVYVDITAPLYWWKEFDTYKIGTVCNSCSTMHRIHSKEFTLDDFSHEHLSCGEYGNVEMMKCVIDCLNVAREKFIETKDKSEWWQMIQLLPSSYNQKRTVMLNYEVVVNIINQRKNHKLDEWHQLVDEFKQLPMIEYLME